MKTIFFTGATGFLGSYLAYKLLSEGNRLILLVRPGASKSGKERADAIMANLIAKLSRNGKFSDILDKYEVVEGDIAKDNLGLDESCLTRLSGMVDMVWHCAASLSFREKDRQKNFEANVNGTRNVLHFAKRVGARLFVHMSTAYVQRGNAGTILEDDLSRPAKFRNSYEETKFRAEEVVRNFARKGEFLTIVLRPSIILGDEILVPSHPYDYYAFLSMLSRMEAKTSFLPLFFPYRPNARLNFMPIRPAVDWMMAIAEKSYHKTSEDKVLTFHIVNPHPPSMKFITEKTLPHFNVRVYAFGAPVWAINIVFILTGWLQHFFPSLRRLSKTMRYFGGYLLGESRYDIGNVRKVLGEEIIKVQLCSGETLDQTIAGFRIKFRL